MASPLKKVLNLSALNCCKWSVVSYKLFQSGTVFKDFTDVQAEESEFSNIGACANPIKMKTHFQFILMNWNITLPKMVRNNILE